MNNKIYVALIFLLLLVIPFSSAIAGFPKHKIISISTNEIAKDNLSVSITIPYDADMRSNFGDLRFTDVDNTTFLNYWFYNNTYIPSTSVNVFIHLPRNLTATQNMTIVMHYGNSTANSLSDIRNAFMFGDDFNSVDNSKWQSGNMGIHTITKKNGDFNGSMTFPSALPVNSLDTIANFSNFKLETRCLFNDSNIGAGSSFGLYATYTPYSFVAGFYSGAGTATATFARINGDTAGLPIDSDTWFRESIAYANDTFGYVNLTNDEATDSIVQRTDTPPSILQAYLIYYQGNADTSYCDWIYVNRFTNKPPTYSIGAEASDNVTFPTPTPVNQTIMVNFVSPTSSGTITASQTIKANLSVSSLNLTRATVWLYNQSTYLASVNFTTQPFYVEFTNLDNGTYFLNATAINIFGNTSNTETRTIIISYNPTIPPIIITPPQTTSSIYNILAFSGAGLAIFIYYVSHGLVYLLIALAVIVIFIVIIHAIKKKIIEGATP